MLFIAGIRPGLATAHFMGAVGRLEGGRRRPLFNLLGRDNYVREAARNAALMRFERDEEVQLRVQAEETEEGRLLIFFQWILDHREEIIALIKMIIELFAGGAVPMQAMGEPMGNSNRATNQRSEERFWITSKLTNPELSDLAHEVLDEMFQRMATAIWKS